MNNFIFILLIILSSIHSKAQILKVAILDFENTSGIAKYDGLGKAMSSMLITDIESNVSSKRLQLVERAQIQKILKEQNFQSTSAVDKTTTVKAGKILGVKYLLVGDIYILNDVLVINARLTDTETGDIKFSKKQEGKLSTWLMLKTNIAKELALSISMQFIEPNIPDKEMNVATITTFGNAVVAKDEGKIEKAEELLNTVQEFSPDFKYLDDLKSQLNVLKKQVEKNTVDIKNLNEEITENITDYLELGYKYSIEKNFNNAEKYFLIGLSKVDKSNIVNYLEYNYALSQLYHKNGNYVESLKYSEMGLSVYPYFKEFLYFKYNSLYLLNRIPEFDKIIVTISDYQNKDFDNRDKDFFKYMDNYSINNKIEIRELDNYFDWNDINKKSNKKICYYNKEYFFNEKFKNKSWEILALNLIQNTYKNQPEKTYNFLSELSQKINYNDINVDFYKGWAAIMIKKPINAQGLFDQIVLSNFRNYRTCQNFKASIPYYCENCTDKIEYYATAEIFDNNSGLESSTDHWGNFDSINEPKWYYKYNDGRKFITTNPIEAYIWDTTSSVIYPTEPLISCIKTLIQSGELSESQLAGDISLLNSLIIKSIINWGHSYFLNNKLDIALKIYNILPSEYKFEKDGQYYDDSFGKMTIKLAIESDYNEFEEKGLISHTKQVEILNKIFKK